MAAGSRQALVAGSRKAAKRAEAMLASKDSFGAYIRFTRPDPDDPDDAERSSYMMTPQGRMLIEVIEKMRRGDPSYRRVAVSIGPQLGKSDILTRHGPAWLSGCKPTWNMIVGAYNQDFAGEFGGDVRALIRSPNHRLVFPEHKLRQGSAATDYLVTEAGGKISFVGIGGSGTGKPADFFFVDDPIRSDADAQSEVHREKVWKWFNGVTFSRLKNWSRVLVVHTRWHEDDLIGRLCDPEHPERNGKYRGIADKWLYLNIPAVVEDPDLAAALGLTLAPQTDLDIVRHFGARPIAALWPEHKDLPLLAEARTMDHRIFDALYMGKPAPDDGYYFKENMLVEYDAHELPKELVRYGASDHAVTEKQQNDPNCIGCVGVDADDTVWVLPDLIWEHMETDAVVESLLLQFSTHKPLIWWMENELISKSFGPFLTKRMLEERVYCTIDPVTPAKDKRTRARAIQGRMAMQKVRFPRFAPWWQKARTQLLKFPFVTNDDFVDWLAHIGMGLAKQVRASGQVARGNVIEFGTAAWLLEGSKARARHEAARKALVGF